jgi:aspartyl-tRNA(Asn)/glutamyl-tRNA(Gln) amidotransferase subunit B
VNLRADIGLEVHVQLRTRSKMFCGCSTGFGAEPNTHVCPVCLGYPGAMPTMNTEAIRLTVITGLAIGSTISEYSKFDRKSYFYPDMPKNYQISQYDRPLCEGGEVRIGTEAGEKVIRIRRIHLEEDVAKNMHFAHASGVDFNRAGTPLMEIVTQPDLESPDEALAFLQALKQILQYAGVSDCNLEEGNIRCDVNCSVRPPGQAELGTKAELKNLNTFKGVYHALVFEVNRQRECVAAGDAVVQETRRWDADNGETYTMRTKEDAHDYRYFPEPDLMPVVLDRDRIAAWRAALPEMPRGRRERLVREYNLPEYDAGVLVADKAVADFFEEAARASGSPKAVSNWIMTEMLRLLGETDRDIRALPMGPGDLASLVRLTERRVVNSNTAKEIFSVLFEQGGDPETIVRERGLAQVSDEDALGRLVEQAMAENVQSVADYRNGKKAAAKFLVGQVMRLSRGKADPQLVARLLDERLRPD